ncbi:MAG: toxin-antitoxin system protein [Candidatus Riflebacteria bacterium]|nr:toxin-antitoxin system protein [Candidatus Riflebacteria bacterium]
MPTTRISTPAHRILQEMARHTGKSMQEVLDAAIEAYRRQRFLQETSEAFGELRADPKAWKAEQDERHLWDATLTDGQKKH